MSDATLDEETVRCPTCRASQVWSDTCRRCKCDLTFLRETARAVAAARRACLSHLARNDGWAALHAARRLVSLGDDAAAQRLLAVCALLCGQWPEALAASRRAATK